MAECRSPGRAESSPSLTQRALGSFLWAFRTSALWTEWRWSWHWGEQRFCTGFPKQLLVAIVDASLSRLLSLPSSFCERSGREGFHCRLAWVTWCCLGVQKILGHVREELLLDERKGQFLSTTEATGS